MKCGTGRAAAAVVASTGAVFGESTGPNSESGPADTAGIHGELADEDAVLCSAPVRSAAHNSARALRAASAVAAVIGVQRRRSPPPCRMECPAGTNAVIAARRAAGRTVCRGAAEMRMGPPPVAGSQHAMYHQGSARRVPASRQRTASGSSGCSRAAERILAGNVGLGRVRSRATLPKPTFDAPRMTPDGSAGGSPPR